MSDDHMLAAPEEREPKVSGERPAVQVAVKRPGPAAVPERSLSDESAVSKFKDYLTNYCSAPKIKPTANLGQVNVGKPGIKNKKRNKKNRKNLIIDPAPTLQAPNPLGSRRDPGKTKRDIEKDKFNKTKEDIVKKLETGLIPPGMEMEDNGEKLPREVNRHLSASPPRHMDYSEVMRYHSPAMNNYVLVDKTSASPEGNHDRFSNRRYSRSHSQEKFFVKDEYLLEGTDRRHSNERYTSRDLQFEQRRGHSRDRNQMKMSRQSHSQSFSPERRVDLRHRLSVNQTRRRGMPRSREISPRRHPRERPPSDDKYSRGRPDSYERRLLDEGSGVRRRRVVDSPNRHPGEKRVKRLPLRMSHNSRDRSDSRERRIASRQRIRIREKKSRLQPGLKNGVINPYRRRSVSLEKLSEREIHSYDPNSNFQSELSIEHPCVTNVPPPEHQTYQYPPTQFTTFEQEHMPPLFEVNTPNMIPYIPPSVPSIVYEEPAPLMYIMPPTQNTFSAPPPPQIRMPVHASPIPVDHYSNSFQRMPPNNQAHSMSAAPMRFQPEISSQQVNMLNATAKNVAAQNATVQQKSNNITVTRSFGDRSTQIINENSRYDSQLKVLQNKMPIKDRLHMEDVIKRCQIAIQKLDYLHLPNRIYCPPPKAPDMSKLKFTSPLVREQVTYDFTSKSSDKKSFLVASIFSTLDIDMEDVPSEPSVTISKFRNVAVQTNSISCDVCMIKNSKLSKSLCKSTMTDQQLVKITKQPPNIQEMIIPPAPPAPVSLMYLTPAKILNPEYNSSQQRMENSAMVSRSNPPMNNPPKNIPSKNIAPKIGRSRRAKRNAAGKAMNMPFPNIANFHPQFPPRNVNPDQIQERIRQQYQIYQNINFDATQKGMFPGFQ